MPMKIEEAKSILQAYRPNGADANDPFFAEALELAEKDPGLRAWFADQQGFDRIMVAEFEQVKAPVDGLDRVLEAARHQNTTTPRRAWWSPLPVGRLALAAGVVLVISATSLFWVRPKQATANSALAEFAIADAQHPKTHGGKGEEAAELNRVLKLPTTRLGAPLPMNFQTLRDTGCRTLKVEGRDVLEVCFKRNGVGLHCYIARKEDFPTLTAPTAPVATDKKDASIATWSDQANLYIVVTKPDRAALEKLFK